ncbi:MAG TPA: hypothetical protein VMX18_01785 [Candidatus Bipolaricaulota bacterium]|nr:hypothetical protein [Candidatus Bipolaricaulota bacterium]
MLSQNSSLKIISNCPVCKAVYYPSEINVVDEKENAHLLHLQCRKCKNCLLVLIIAGAKGISSVGLVTELDSEEALKYLRGNPVSADEVLDIREKINNSNKFLEIIKK